MNRPITIELAWLEDSLLGPPLAIVDTLRLINALSALRHRGQNALLWRWRNLKGSRVARQWSCGPMPAGTPDVLIVPGWMARNGPHLDRLVRQHRALGERIRHAHQAGADIVGIYTGGALLAAAGLLQGRAASLPWAFAQSILRQDPSLLIQSQSFSESDRAWTCDTPLAAVPMLLQCLRRRGMAALTDSVEHLWLHSDSRQRLSAIASRTQTSRTGPGSIERARRYLEDHQGEPYDLGRTAAYAATSPRSLLRHFRQVQGQTPLQYLHGLRSTRARMLLETSYLSIEEIALQCGYRDVAMFRRIFARETGLKPSDYRDRYRLRSPRRDWGRDLRQVQ